LQDNGSPEASDHRIGGDMKIGYNGLKNERSIWDINIYIERER
jgi:hypothetical protein